ncbi:MAG TPA: hypothetical protein VFQ39_02770 [Longimicrobium sp.]|nr:hypothetical protein [Longimicrobium sp.]
MPEVLARLGPPATATSLALLADDTVSSFVRVSIMTALRSLARNHPSERDMVVAGLVAELQKSSNDEEFVGFVVSSLVELGAVEAAPAIQRAYEEDRVAEWIPGDWEDVQVGLGILEKRLTPKPRYVTPGLPPLPGWAPRAEPNPSPAGGGPAKNKAKAKAKKKQEAKSRKKNRRK